MRDLRNQRKEMYEVFKLELDKRGIQYHLVTGDWNEREVFIKSIVNIL
jgi:HTH-type transcriptional regulator, transcriptional repressor of NAD biosynthesis genes